MPETHSERGAELAHDILAAEAFAMPAPDPRLRHNLILPEDPAGLLGPHDILAAEEFAMPAPESDGRPRVMRQDVAPVRSLRTGLAGAGLLALWLRRRGR